MDQSIESPAGRPVRVLMVCLGNICRSPTAHAVLEQMLRVQGLQHRFEVDSAGTAGWHAGESPDPRTILAARRRGYDLSPLVARQISEQDYLRFDYLLAMDHQNLAALEAQRPPGCSATIRLLLDFAGRTGGAVPDPYHEGPRGFETVLDLVEEAAAGLLDHLVGRHVRA